MSKNNKYIIQYTNTQLKKDLLDFLLPSFSLKNNKNDINLFFNHIIDSILNKLNNKRVKSDNLNSFFSNYQGQIAKNLNQKDINYFYEHLNQKKSMLIINDDFLYSLVDNINNKYLNTIFIRNNNNIKFNGFEFNHAGFFAFEERLSIDNLSWFLNEKNIPVSQEIVYAIYSYILEIYKIQYFIHFKNISNDEKTKLIDINIFDRINDRLNTSFKLNIYKK